MASTSHDQKVQSLDLSNHPFFNGAIMLKETPDRDSELVDKFVNQILVMANNPTFTKSKRFIFAVVGEGMFERLDDLANSIMSAIKHKCLT